MTPEMRGGNSRLLAKNLDSLDKPAAILDRRGQIVFVNSALCAMAGGEATQLVGKQCSWEIADDTTPFAAILVALAPPATARHGRIAVRQLTTPVVYGSTASGQLFVPLLDEDQVVHATLVVFGSWQEVQQQLPEPVTSAHQRRQFEQTLVSIRSRWARLDELHALVGISPAIRLAMNRAQMALDTSCNFWLEGPTGSGKSEVCHGIFGGRLKAAGLQPVVGQYFPVDCNVLDAALIDGMLEVFASRLRTGAPKAAQQLVLEHLDRVPAEAAPALHHWLEQHQGDCVVVGTSRTPIHELAQRDRDWQVLVSTIATTEIRLPPLRERREDIPSLVLHALAACCRAAERAALTMAPDAMDLLEAYSWPQNLKQLRQAIEDSVHHAVLTAAIHVQHLPVEIRTFSGSAQEAAADRVEPIHLDSLLEDLERIVLSRALKLSPRNRAQVARWLNISRPRLLRRISQLGLDDNSKAGSTERE